MLWLEGFSAIFRVIHDIFEAGKIPSLIALLEALHKLPKDKLKLVQAYEKSTEIESALEALVRRAKEDWEWEFKDIHCDSDMGWDALPVCAKHDFDWSLARDMLVG